jgi:para-nitrobenzyl esterase
MPATRWLFAACIALAAQLCAAASPVERHTRFGSVVGLDNAAADGTWAWKGVPFAQPPVGALRWAPPVDPQPWSTPKATQAFGNACAQYGRIYGPGANNRYDATIGTTLLQAVGHEDCLYLNIWRPATRQGGLPVMVFVHGGSNVSGYTADPVYDGAALAKAANAVVVSVNYRLGILGFLDIAQLQGAGNASGNYALLDIAKALEFVQRNVANFGGNPASVTLMGQSAGAINVWAMLASPLVVGQRPALFHRAVPLSGGISLASNLPPGTLPTLNPRLIAQLQGAALLRELLIADGLATDAASATAYVASRTPEQIAAYLRGKTPAQLLFTLLVKLAPLGLAGSGPIPDGLTLAVDPVGAIKAGDYHRVPVLAGNTRDEGKLFPSFLPLVGGTGNARKVTDAQLFAIQFAYDPEAAPTVQIGDWITAPYLPVDAPVTGFTARAETLNRIFFGASRDNVLDALKTQQHDVWYYRFDWDEQPAPWNDIYGAAHLWDLFFVFGNFGESLFGNVSFTAANAPGRLALSNAMMQSLAAFARSGDPNAAVLGTTWPTWPAKLVFDATPGALDIGVEP